VRPPSHVSRQQAVRSTEPPSVPSLASTLPRRSTSDLRPSILLQRQSQDRRARTEEEESVTPRRNSRKVEQEVSSKSYMLLRVPRPKVRRIAPAMAGGPAGCVGKRTRLPSRKGEQAILTGSRLVFRPGPAAFSWDPAFAIPGVSSLSPERGRESMAVRPLRRFIMLRCFGASRCCSEEAARCDVIAMRYSSVNPRC